MRLAFYFWARAAVPHLGILPHEVVVVRPDAPTPVRVIGRRARDLATNYGAIAGAIADYQLVPLTAEEADDLALGRRFPPIPLTAPRRRSARHLRVV